MESLGDMFEVAGTVGEEAGVRFRLTLRLTHDITLNADSEQVTALSHRSQTHLSLKSRMLL